MSRAKIGQRENANGLATAHALKHLVTVYFINRHIVMKNKYGLDESYFTKNLKKILENIDCYTPKEMALALGRLSRVADAPDYENATETNSEEE